MAIKQFALPLTPDSLQTGDISFQELVDNNEKATFQITNVVSGGDKLNLITQKGGGTINHEFEVTVASGTGSVELSTTQLASVYNDADGEVWDYIEARWLMGQVDKPATSNMYEIQGSKQFDLNGWPPNK